jgi:membrane fusion protein (multidrug efflux system)
VTRDSAGNATTLVVGAGDKVELRTIQVSRAVGDQWLVTDGLKTGDRVIVEGVQKASPGALVKVVNLGGAEPVVDNK